jgi:MoaA/NifB/PqqE/SkfB family radical SAM enzyme
MSIDALARILNLFPRALSVCFSGSGEPLLHPEFFEMIRLVHQRRKKVHVFTNGTLLAGRIGRLLEAPVRFLNVSLYGIDGESFNQLTGAPAGLLGETVDAVTELARRRRPGGYPQILRANIICTKDTMHNAVAGIRLCEQIGVDQVKLKNLTCHEVTGYDETVCLHEDDPEVKEFIRGLRRERFRIPVFLPRLYRKDDKARQCSVPFYALSVDGDGSTAPCFVAGTDKKWGNVLEQPGLWNGPVMVEARRNLLDLSQPLARTCRHCEHMIRERTYVGG